MPHLLWKHKKEHVSSAALSINNQGNAVGIPNDASGNARAFLWQDGVMYDLNDPAVIPAGSALFLLFAAGLNSRDGISGFGLTSNFEVHASWPLRCTAQQTSGAWRRYGTGNETLDQTASSINDAGDIVGRGHVEW